MHPYGMRMRLISDMGDTITFTYSPEEISDVKETRWTDEDQEGLCTPWAQYKGGGFRQLSFTLFLNDIGNPAAKQGESVADTLAKLRKMQCPPGRGDPQMPPVLMLVPDPILGGVFRCVLTSTDITVLMTNRSFVPVRATVAITLVEYVPGGAGR